MMDPSPQSDPLSIASILLFIAGIAAYCCGSFVCLGWIGLILWTLGAILGGAALFRVPEGGSKLVPVIGLILNLLALLTAIALLAMGVGIVAISEILKHR